MLVELIIWKRMIGFRSGNRTRDRSRLSRASFTYQLKVFEPSAFLRINIYFAQQFGGEGHRRPVDRLYFIVDSRIEER